LEFAMVVPLLGLLLGLMIQTGLLLADVVVAHGIAREAGRTAAVEGVERARQVAERTAGGRDVRVDVDDDAGVVEVSVELATGAFSTVGVDLWLPARATFRRETPFGAGAGGG
jgi:Flp pilus assembly protein TadG